MSTPTNRRYTKTHEWIALDGDVATIGITDFAQSELGDITYLELPEVGDEIALDQAFGIVESVKAANDIFSPVDGEVVARNEDAVGAPETLNQSPYDSLAERPPALVMPNAGKQLGSGAAWFQGGEILRCAQDYEWALRTIAF